MFPEQDHVQQLSLERRQGWALETSPPKAFFLILKKKLPEDHYMVLPKLFKKHFSLIQCCLLSIHHIIRKNTTLLIYFNPNHFPAIPSMEGNCCISLTPSLLTSPQGKPFIAQRSIVWKAKGWMWNSGKVSGMLMGHVTLLDKPSLPEHELIPGKP